MVFLSQQNAPSGAFFWPRARRFLGLAVGLLLCWHAVAQSATAQLGDPGSQAGLAQSATWHRLLHYERTWNGQVLSAIHSPEFFLDPQGASDPTAELAATLRALQLPLVRGQEDQHAACRFPARRAWLESRLPELQRALRTELQALHCPAFEEWGGAAGPASISLMFANGYLGNPASYYGHLFLKFNSEKGGQSYLLDRTENFGALDVKGDNPVQYIVKALVGSYDGGFSQIDFFYHDAAYTENEFRDLWEYRLDLTPQETRFITAHAWEIHRKRYTYYFFHDNCAYRVAELLELLDGVQAVPRSAPWVIPQAVVAEVAKQSLRGKPLVKQRLLHPSRQSRLYQRFAGLNAEQQQALQSVAAGAVGLDEGAVRRQPVQDQARMVDTLLDYYQFTRNSVDASGEKRLPAEYYAALKARLDLPPSASATKEAPPQVGAAPDAGHPPGWLQLGWGTQEGGGTVQTLRIRPAYYDDLDSEAAQPAWSGLSMGDLQLERQADTVQVKRLDIVAINSHRPSVTGLPGDGGYGWVARFGLEKQSLACSDCQVWRLQSDYRKVVSLPSRNAMLAVGVGGGLQSNRNDAGPTFASFVVKASKRFDGGSHLNLSHEVKSPLDRPEATRHADSLEWRTPLARALDFRVMWERDGVARTTIGLGAYW
ncbi:DUF4105 domain-containing protein [Curvibacter sp. APW13]|uniref:Lnb N-terminal periplasmic domain-containing protein n=1 Tax=Curvibacter sp. APW13 TaxID=3077236 RepID=UPI0028DFE52F|nr:DUF4105 domain-containing protein [Curvibacter sp. APW13]MDT8992453.1 DUF4105 domain-containing protein [Curvibacter sp. APW13]